MKLICSTCHPWCCNVTPSVLRTWTWKNLMADLDLEKSNKNLICSTCHPDLFHLSSLTLYPTYTHRCVIHRHVKSANVLMDRGCQDRIDDFDIAKSLNDNNTDITLTHIQAEHVMGTQGVNDTRVYECRAVDESGRVCFRTRCPGYVVCSPAPGTQFTCFTSTILQILTPETLCVRSPQLDRNVSG